MDRKSYSNHDYPYFRQCVADIGLESPAEQYGLYGSIIVAAWNSIKALRKARNLEKWLSETDEGLKAIYTVRGQLSPAELAAGKPYLIYLRAIPR